MSDTENEIENYASYSKKAWIIYSVVAAVIVIFLATVVAQDNEEILFYSLMSTAVFYVFRPTEKFMKKQILRFVKPS